MYCIIISCLYVASPIWRFQSASYSLALVKALFPMLSLWKRIWDFSYIYEFCTFLFCLSDDVINQNLTLTVVLGRSSTKFEFWNVAAMTMRGDWYIQWTRNKDVIWSVWFFAVDSVWIVIRWTRSEFSSRICRVSKFLIDLLRSFLICLVEYIYENQTDCTILAVFWTHYSTTCTTSSKTLGCSRFNDDV